MLHAFSHRKSRLYQRYLGHRDETSEKRVAEEDEITSLIMGPLALFPPSVIAAFWLGLVRLRNPEHVFPTGVPTSGEMHFWPRRGRIEPDLRVDLAWGGDTRTLLVEFKWRAPLSGKEQLHDQWRNYLSEEERAKGLHLFIGLDTSEGINALNRGDIWKGRLLMRSWFDVLTTLSTLHDASGLELRRWGEQVKHTLALLAVRPFEGFHTLPRPCLAQSSAPIFFNTIQFRPMEPSAMNEVGKSISSSFAFVSRVGQECEALANLLKQEVSNLFKMSPLHERYIPGEWVHSYKTDEHGWIFTDVAWSLPLVPKGKRKVAAHLSFQMSFLCGNPESGMSTGPLLHVNFWDDAVQFDNENYMGFPMGGIADSTLATLQSGGARLFRWEGGNGADDRWTYTVGLTDINEIEDIRRLVGRPVVQLLMSVDDGQAALEQLQGVARYSAAENMPDYYHVNL